MYLYIILLYMRIYLYINILIIWKHTKFSLMLVAFRKRIWWITVASEMNGFHSIFNHTFEVCNHVNTLIIQKVKVKNKWHMQYA